MHNKIYFVLWPGAKQRPLFPLLRAVPGESGKK
jgi:hypothetical protein